MLKQEIWGMTAASGQAQMLLKFKPGGEWGVWRGGSKRLTFLEIM